MAEDTSQPTQASQPQPRNSGSKPSLLPIIDAPPKSASSSQADLTADDESFSGTLTDSVAEPSDQNSSKVEAQLSEAELRRLFDDEEIERFLSFFADSVSEVALPSALSHEDVHSTHGLFKEEPETPGSSSSETCGGDWLSIDSNSVPSHSRIPPSASNATCISERIAFTYVFPALPPARPRPQRFTLGNLRVSIQRVYFVAHSAYRKLFSRLTHLATWKDRRESALYCAIFWMLWYQNLLMPATFFRILYSLLRRRFLPYPTLEELRTRRREAALTEELGEQIQIRLGMTSSSDLLEAWRLFRVFTKPNKAKSKQKGAKGQGESAKRGKNKKETTKESMKLEEEGLLAESGTEEGNDSVTSEPVVDVPAATEVRSSDMVGDSTVLDAPNESQKETDIKLALVNSLNDLADVHERVKNIFLWRLPSTSRAYAILLMILIILTIYLPTKYIVKTALFLVGFLYWHVVPIIVALPPHDRSRLPPLFDGAPTDAEYAMALISQRISRGEDIQPPAKKLSKKSKKTTIDSKSNKSMASLVGDEHSEEQKSTLSGSGGDEMPKAASGRPGEVDWRKWGERAYTIQSWAAQGRRNEKDGDDKAVPDEDFSGEIHTFLAQHRASPGTLAISPTALLFTPVTATRPKIRIAMDDMRGVKKIGLSAVPGVSIKWQRSSDSRSYNGTETEEMRTSEIVEEKFRWVGGRDEVFARLVGWGGRKWLKV